MDQGIIRTSTAHFDILQMNHSRANVVNSVFLELLTRRISEIPQDRTLLLMGNGHFFSAGIDLKYAHELDSRQMTGFIDEFQELLLNILNRSGFSAVLLNGHAVAGGFLISCTADLRLTIPNHFKMGMNDRELGIQLPPVPAKLIQLSLGNQAENIVGTGQFVTSEILQQIGFLRHITDNNLEELGAVLEKQIEAVDWREQKIERQREMASHVQHCYLEETRKFVHAWCSPEARFKRSTVLERL